MSIRNLIDVSRLTECERELWEESCRNYPDEAPALKLFGFAHLCMLMCAGIPAVVADKYAELDPDGMLKQYMENVKKAHRNS